MHYFIIFRVQKRVTFCRAVKQVVLGLGRHRLQIRSIFLNVVGKSAQFEVGVDPLLTTQQFLGFPFYRKKSERRKVRYLKSLLRMIIVCGIN